MTMCVFGGVVSMVLWMVEYIMEIKNKTAQESPEEKEELLPAFLQKIRRNSQRSQFPPSYIYNMDQTPIPFDFLQSRTYAPKGSKTVWIKTDRNAWTKRQATLMLTVCADGIMRCLPILIFHGKYGHETATRQAERRQYHPGVRVLFNLTVYSSEAITLDWIRTDICSMTLPYDRLEPERLVTLDIFGGQTTQAVKDLMNELHVYIPEGCAGYIQPLDTILNKLLKDRIADGS